MSTLVSAVRVRFDADSMWVELSDGRTIGVPLAWFPRLLHASAEEREQVRVTRRGLHWEALNEDISGRDCWLVQGTRAGKQVLRLEGRGSGCARWRPRSPIARDRGHPAGCWGTGGRQRPENGGVVTPTHSAKGRRMDGAPGGLLRTRGKDRKAAPGGSGLLVWG